MYPSSWCDYVTGERPYEIASSIKAWQRLFYHLKLETVMARLFYLAQLALGKVTLNRRNLNSTESADQVLLSFQLCK